MFPTSVYFVIRGTLCGICQHTGSSAAGSDQAWRNAQLHRVEKINQSLLTLDGHSYGSRVFSGEQNGCGLQTLPAHPTACFTSLASARARRQEWLVCRLQQLLGTLSELTTTLR
ncbi:hypothetical protein IF2G_09839 [Cordyceps javanica]|nr:hypothetical protein IF2G_09839 [Cordyceps javanica]